MDLYITILLMVLAFCVGLLISTCCLLYFLLFKRKVKPDTTIRSDPSTFVHFPSPGLTPFRSSHPSLKFVGSLEDSLPSAMSFGRILEHHQMNTLELALQNVLALHEQHTYIESIVGRKTDLSTTISNRQIVDKRYPTRQLFHSTLPTIVDVPELPEVHNKT